jgi:virulence factor Mce-like protein
LVWGCLLIVLTILAVGLIFASFGGAFSQFTVVTAELPLSSTAVALNSPVEYRDVTVGKVASQGRSIPGGLVSVVLHLKPSKLRDIPAGVQATVTPVSFFGNEYIVLQPPANIGPGTLRSGQVIPPLSNGQTASLQTTLGDLDHLLIELHPAQLDAALTALAGAIQGQGTSLGQNLDKTNTYLSGMLPLWPTLVTDLQTLVPVANTFAAATPNLLQILANQTTTAQTITSSAANVHTALGGGATLAAESDQLLTAIQQPFTVLAADSGPFLQDIAQNPQEISQLLSGLDTWAKSWLAAEASGPYLSLTANVSVINPADLGLAVLGGPDVASDLAAGLGASYINPATYTSADCPTFGSLSGCGGVTTASATTAGPKTSAAAELAALISSAPTPVLAEPAQTQAVAKIVSAATDRSPADPAVSTLLLSPVLQGLVARS